MLFRPRALSPHLKGETERYLPTFDKGVSIRNPGDSATGDVTWKWKEAGRQATVFKEQREVVMSGSGRSHRPSESHNPRTRRVSGCGLELEGRGEGGLQTGVQMLGAKGRDKPWGSLVCKACRENVRATAREQTRRRSAA